ncbi:TPA: McrB family protein [Streptococcus suis]
MGFKEWAISSGKLNEKTAATYWSGLTNTRFKEDGIAVADVTSIDELTERIGKDTIDTQDIEKLFNKPSYRPDSDIKSFVQKYIDYLKSETTNGVVGDYENFFEMLKFWIKQTDNNIVNDGHRVSFEEIQEGNLDRAVMKFTEPQFHKQYIQFSDFAIRISFFRSGQYKGEKVNFVACRPTGFGSWWLNIRYLYDLKQLRVSYRRDLPNNSDRQAFKDYMTALDYQKDVSFSIGELGLTQSEPNSKVKELFDYFHNMIVSARNYEEVDGENVKAMELSEKLKQNYNLILRGAPGTGKTYLAKEIAASIIGIPKEELASSDQFEFVQFHPSYDYTDFVEGLRPVQINGQVGFEPKNGTFKEFCKNALLQQNVQFDSFDNIWENFINNVDEAGEVVIPQVRSERELTYSLNSNRTLKEENVNSVHTLTKEKIFRVWQGLKGRESGGHQSRMTAVVNYLKDQYNLPDYDESLGKNTGVSDKKYVFVIDEINRGEISKIFGELFFSIDPEYRGVAGSVSTQYANLFEESEKFYVPENVYIIGTMNDIDRSVDTFDFAMRRRFSFEEITAADSQVMLKSDEVKNRMTALNDAIISPEVSLSNDYQIGASYFRALEDESKNIGVDELWQNKLKPLLKDYFRGERNAEHKLEILESAYFMGDANDSCEG